MGPRKKTSLHKKKTIHIVGACLDLGAGRRGVDMGASALRLAGINQAIRQLGFEVLDAGNIPAPIPESGHFGKKNAKYLKEITTFCKDLNKTVGKISALGHQPIVLGGDHTIAIGSISAMAHEQQRNNNNIGVLWIDAHADMNTPETSSSGNIHGMPMAVLLGHGPKELCSIPSKKPKIDPKNVALVGIRSIDKKESALVKKTGVNIFTMRTIDERGIKSVMDEALDKISQNTSGLWVSLDMDGCDPSLAPGVGTPVTGGLTYREAHLAMEMVADRKNLLGLDITEINPILDRSNTTAKFAVELTLSLLGKKIF